MSDVFSTWIAANGNTSSFGPLTAQILATQNVTQFGDVGIQFSQQFFRALVDAATNGGSA